MLERDPNQRFQSIEEVMRHPWFNDVIWGHVLNKTIKPTLVPVITHQYLANDEGDDDDAKNTSRLSFFGGTPGTPSAMSKSDNGRRHSYYIHSTVFLPSQIADDRLSFIRSPSQMKHLFDSSALLTN